MKIGFFGNTNNYPFTLARAMRRMGHDIRFVVDRPEPLNRPESRHADISVPYPGWIVDISPLELHVPLRSPQPARARAIALLQECDAVILNMLGPSLLPEIRRPAVVLLTGSDLEDYANYRFLSTYRRQVKGKIPWTAPREMRLYLDDIRLMARIIARQRAGIRMAAGVNYFARGFVKRGDLLLDGIGVPEARRMFFIMTETDGIHPCPPPRNPVVRIFSVARLTWHIPGDGSVATGKGSELDYKGTDVMIRGLGMFRRTVGTPLDIRLVKKGRHVRETMELVEAEGISDQVTWLEEMSQKDVLEEYAKADIVIDQLGNAVIGMGGVDAMAAGKPVIVNSRPDIMTGVFGKSLPVCQAASPEEVREVLARLVGDPAERERAGRESRRFAEEFFSPDHAARICLERLARKTGTAG
jgi:glycosyltransferase involved in cell wall biosynthesis